VVSAQAFCPTAKAGVLPLLTEKAVLQLEELSSCVDDITVNVAMIMIFFRRVTMMNYLQQRGYPHCLALARVVLFRW